MESFLGNQSAVEQLQTVAQAGSPAHAYAFLGPRHVGRHRLATDLAAILLCNGEQPPCGHCAECALLTVGNHPDLLQLPREDALTIAQVRALRQELALKPLRGSWRVGIVPDAERLGVPAQNALLKTLEEPPPRTVLILTASGAQALLPTTMSRCQAVTLRPMPTEVLATQLTGDIKEVAAAAKASGGRPGLAKRLLADPDALAQRTAWTGQLAAVGGMGVTERLRLAAELQPHASDAVDHWIDVVRQTVAATHTEADAGEGAAVVNRYTPEQLRRGLIQLVALRGRIGYNPNVLVQLEHTILTFTE